MKLKDLTLTELEAMSYDDIAFMILTEEGEKMKITDLFKKVCDLLKLDEKAYEAKIANFFQLLSTDKRFTMLDKGFWDLKSKHQAKIIIENDDDEDEELLNSNDDEEDESKEDENLFYDGDETDDTSDNDLQDLVVISDDEDEANTSL